jgi:serine/threonine protein kinase
MPDSLVPGSTFAGCRLEGVAGRGGMGVVFRATQLALQRPVALKAIAPELAADEDYRERFQRESHLAASLDHPNVIPVYEAGELDGTLYLMMRWVEGTDLRTLLITSGRVSPGRAINLLRPVASALAAAHRRGLVHRDIKPANVMIARGDEEDDDDHVYLTDFGIARRVGGDSLTRTGTFVGTVDYTAPERIVGGKGDAAADIYSLGCVLFETLTGHVPFDRPTDVSKIYAHVNDPIPSARAEVAGVPERLDAIIVKAMAKRPEDRFASAGELAVALGQALQELETAERVPAAPKPRPGVADAAGPTVTAQDAATRIQSAAPSTDADTTRIEPAGRRTEPDATPSEPGTTRIEPTPRPNTPGTTRIEPTPRPNTPGTTRIEPGPTRVDPEATVSGPPAAPTRPESRVAAGSTSARRWRPSPLIWLVPILVLAVVGVLVATLSGGGSSASQTSVTSTPTPGSGSAGIRLHGGGMTVGRTIGVSSLPGSVSLGTRNVWVSLPDAGRLVRTNQTSGAPRNFAAHGRPNALAAGVRGLWVAATASDSLAQFNGGTGTQVAAVKLPGSPTALALDQDDSSAWVADSSGAISHVAIGPTVVGTAAHSAPAATSLAWGEGWLWAVNGSDKGLVRVSLVGDGSSTTFAVGPSPIGVTLDQGVWIAHANGHVTRFDPRAGHLGVNADIAVAPELDAIAAADPSPFVWAISQSQKTVYRITNTSQPAVTGTIVLNSPPVALAVNAHSIWVATRDHTVTQIRF